MRIIPTNTLFSHGNYFVGLPVEENDLGSSGHFDGVRVLLLTQSDRRPMFTVISTELLNHKLRTIESLLFRQLAGKLGWRVHTFRPLVPNILQILIICTIWPI